VLQDVNLSTLDAKEDKNGYGSQPAWN